MKKIFISYRRSDTSAASGRIFDRLVKRFGKDAVFKDVDVIPLGVDFRKHIRNAIEQSAVQLVLIGPRWLDVADEYGRRRLDQADDPVRMEIEIALRLEVAVMPVLIDGAQLPSATSLPAAISQLAHMKAFVLNIDHEFDLDLSEAFLAIETFLRGERNRQASSSDQLLPVHGLHMGRRIAISLGLAAVAMTTTATAWWFVRSNVRQTATFPLPQVRWQSRVPGLLTAGPAVAEGLVYAVADGNILLALNASDGSVRWRQLLERQTTGVIAVDGGLLCVGSPDGYVYGFNAKNGMPLWQWQSRGSAPGNSLPAVAAGQPFIYSNSGLGTVDFTGHVVRLDGTNGSQLWSYTCGGTSEWPPVIANGVLYAGTSNAEVFALATLDGSLKWSQVAAPVADTVPTLLGATVFIGSTDGHTQALDAMTGSIMWTTATADSVHFPPAIDLASVYVGAENGTLYALHAHDGSVRWRRSIGGAIISSPLVLGDAVLAPSSDRYLYAFGAVNGELRWRYAVGGIPTGLVAANGIGYLGTADGLTLALSLF